MMLGLKGVRDHFAYEALRYRRGVRDLRAAGFKKYSGDLSLEWDEKIIEAKVGPDGRSVWVRTVEEQ